MVISRCNVYGSLGLQHDGLSGVDTTRDRDGAAALHVQTHIAVFDHDVAGIVICGLECALRIKPLFLDSGIVPGCGGEVYIYAAIQGQSAIA